MLKAADVLRRVGSKSLDFMRIYGRSTLTSVAFVWTQRPSLRVSSSRILPTFGRRHGNKSSACGRVFIAWATSSLPPRESSLGVGSQGVSDHVRTRLVRLDCTRIELREFVGAKDD